MISMVGVGFSPERLKNRNVCSESMENTERLCWRITQFSSFVRYIK